MGEKKEAEGAWFEEWFDSPYYHMLYSHRNEAEAEAFIDALTDYLDFPAGARVLDLACGKGRHSKALYERGLRVVGVDLSPCSIEAARKCETRDLNFQVHDMREVIPGQRFQAIFNLFTSFGYFDDASDNLKMLKSIHEMLLPNGDLIIDFLNVPWVLANMLEEETKKEGLIEFKIRRWYDGKHIFKQIEFDAEGRSHCFRERVQGIGINDFEKLLEASGFDLIKYWGSYQLETYQEASKRLILHARKR
ncbi:MAG: class I SAM-dependent methyltransferase [Bacteroidetes bacterium]|nr:MAG: class I SAM-dependent methyltransferase [Bacteroidota bacterium]